MSEVYGCDFSLFKPSVQSLVTGGFTFVMGYVSNGNPKDLTQPLLAEYGHAGIHVGLVWETTANRALSGTAGGTTDGALANVQAKAIGYPTNSPIFFAVDWDAQPSEFGAILDYGRAFNQNIVNPTGIYGSYNVIEHFVTPNVQPIQYGWQSAAWSGDRLSLKAHLYQRSTHHHLLPGAALSDYDEDVLCRPLPLMGMNTPTPPQPLEVYYIIKPGDTLTSIAYNFHTTVAQLIAWNHVSNPDNVAAGARIRVR